MLGKSRFHQKFMGNNVKEELHCIVNNKAGRFQNKGQTSVEPVLEKSVEMTDVSTKLLRVKLNFVHVG